LGHPHGADNRIAVLSAESSQLLLAQAIATNQALLWGSPHMIHSILMVQKITVHIRNESYPFPGDLPMKHGCFHPS
jgi:hypothetical protein